MDVSPKVITRAIKELKPRYQKEYKIPGFQYVYISVVNGAGVMACIDADKDTGFFFVKSVMFPCEGLPVNMMVKSTLLRDIAKACDESMKFVANGKKTIAILADRCLYRLDTIDPADFPAFNPEETEVSVMKTQRAYADRQRRIQQILYDTTHEAEVRSRKCREILLRMKK